MRLGYLGDGPWAQLAFDRILASDDVEIAFVIPRFQNPDPILRQKATQAQIDFLPMADVNAPASLDRLRDYEVDLLVSMSFDQIMRRPILELAPSGAINCHAGALPFYRGRNVLNWALINDEPEFGVTVHYMDEGIDTGDILLQRFSTITDDDTYATLLDRAVELCAETLADALSLLAAGQAERIPQSSIHPVGTYTGRRGEGDEWIDWSWSSRRIFNFVRAITSPGPCARTLLDGAEVRVVRAEMIPGAPHYVATVGEIVGKDGDTICVKTGDSTIALTEVHAAEEARLRIGRRFRSTTEARIQRLEDRLAKLEDTVEARLST